MIISSLENRGVWTNGRFGRDAGTVSIVDGRWQAEEWQKGEVCREGERLSEG